MSEYADCVALHERQNFGPGIGDAALAPIADYVGLQVEDFSKPADPARCFDGLIKNIHSGQSITKVSRTAISFETSAFEGMKTIAERLVFARKSKGPVWTQRHLAIAAGVSTGTIGNMELGLRGATGSIPGTLPQIAKALEVPFDWLAYGTGEPYPAPQPPAVDRREPAPALTPDAVYVGHWLDKVRDGERRERLAHACVALILREIDGPASMPTPAPESDLETPSVAPRARPGRRHA